MRWRTYLAFGHRDRLNDEQAGTTRGWNVVSGRSPRNVETEERASSPTWESPIPWLPRWLSRLLAAWSSRLPGTVVHGDDVTAALTPDTQLLEGMTIGEVGREYLGANAYLGVDALLPAIESGSDLIITGRVADPSLFLAPQMAHFGWRSDDWNVMSKAR